MLLNYCNNNSVELKFYLDAPKQTSENYVIISAINEIKNVTIYGTIKEISVDIILVINQNKGLIQFDLINKIKELLKSMNGLNVAVNLTDENLGLINNLQISYTKFNIDSIEKSPEYNLSRQKIQLISGVRLSS